MRVPTYPSHVFSPFYKGVSEDDVRDAAKIRKILPITIIDVHLFFFFFFVLFKKFANFAILKDASIGINTSAKVVDMTFVS